MRTLRVLVSVALAVGVLVALLAWSGISPRAVGAAALRVEPRVLASAFGALVLLYGARALRIRLLLPAALRPPWPRLSAATAAWILDAQVLPAKVGEATLVWHLRRLGVPSAEGFVALVVSRLLDLAVLLGAFGCAALALGLAGGDPAAASFGARLPWLVPLGACLLPVALVLGALVARGAAAWRCVPRLLARLGFGGAGVMGRVLAFSERVGEALAAVDGRRRAWAVLASVAVWALILGFYALLAVGLGVESSAGPPLGLFGLVFGASLAVLGGLVPASGFLGFGMLDVGWVAGFAVLGVPRELAVESGLAFHVLYLVGVGVLGVVGHLMLAGRAPAAPPKGAR
ncbi:MAG: lysylphosphatidylglycerol synthase transmembrane domain-containing protein [Planctomycetota bacterium]